MAIILETRQRDILSLRKIHTQICLIFLLQSLALNLDKDLKEILG